MGIKKGQALFLVLLLLAVIGAICAALTLMWKDELQTRSSERDGLAAFYLAQAGIERAKIEARYDPGLTGWSVWQAFGSGRYRYYVGDLGGNRRQLQSQGQALDASGNPLSERQLIVEIRGIGTPPSADDAQESWTWREI